jgi:hypothetical protein
MTKTGSSEGGWHPSSKYMPITWKSLSNRASNCARCFSTMRTLPVALLYPQQLGTRTPCASRYSSWLKRRRGASFPCAAGSPRAYGVRSRTCGRGGCTRHSRHRTPRHRPRAAVQSPSASHLAAVRAALRNPARAYRSASQTAGSARQCAGQTRPPWPSSCGCAHLSGTAWRSTAGRSPSGARRRM